MPTPNATGHHAYNTRFTFLVSRYVSNWAQALMTIQVFLGQLGKAFAPDIPSLPLGVELVGFDECGCPN